jgi:hypothetical protein
MAAARAPIPRVHRLGVLLVGAIIAAALGGVAPAAASPAAERRSAVDRQVAEILRLNPGSRRISATSVLLEPGVVMTVPGPVKAGATMTVPTRDGGQLTVSASDTSCAYQWLCMWQHIYRGGAKLAFYYCKIQWLGDYTYRDAADGKIKSWRDTVSSIWNNQSGGAVSYFYNYQVWGDSYIGGLSAGNYLQDLTRNASADGGSWNDKIDRVIVC